MLEVHLETGTIATRQARIPQRDTGFALLRLVRAGICSTDLELQRGYYGFSGRPGHEFVAEVVDADSHNFRGKRVVGEINFSCDSCDWCRRNLGRHCPNRTVLGIVNQPGAFAEYFVAPERNLHIVPEIVSSDAAVFIEPLAAACELLDQVTIPPHQPVAVLGDGKLGLLIAQVLRAHAYPVHIFGKHRDKLAIAETVGASVEVIRPNSLPIATYDWVVDATGSPDGLRAAVAMTRPRGTLMLKSTVHGMVPIDTAPIIVNELTLVGSRCGRFEAAIPLLECGLVRVDQMVSDTFALADAPRAFARAAERGVLKVLLQP